MNNQIKRSDRSGGVLPAIFNRYFNDSFFNNFSEDFLPATNVKETKKEFKLDISVPGFSKEDFKVEIDKNVLVISAEKNSNTEEKSEDEKVLRREFTSSSFSRSFTLPENIDTDKITANQKDGVLRITLPKMDKAPEDKIKKIEIK